MSKTILLRAPLLTMSGYGVHARQIGKWLFENCEKLDLDIHTELLNWGNTPWITDVNAHNGLIGEFIGASNSPKPFYDVTIQLQLPNEWAPTLGKYNIGVTAGIETDRCKPEWIDCINKMNLVVVPSEFTKRCFLNTSELSGKKLITDIIVIPESFPDVLMKDDLPELPLKFSSDFNFLVFGQLTGNNPENDRKNLFYTFKWFSETFAGNPDVGMVFKTNVGRLTKLDKAIVRNLFQRLLFEMKVNPTGPKFYLLHGDMTEEEVGSLFRHPKIKGFLTLTRGEGLGLPILEASASGLPILATDWSAYTEFLNLGKWIKIEADINTIHESRVDNLFPKDAKWAYPKETDAKMRMMKFTMNSEVPKKWAEELKWKIRENYSFKAISEHYNKLFIKVLEEC